MNLQFKGVVKQILPKTTGNSNGKEWSKTSVVIEEVADKYPASILIDAFNKQTEIDKITEGCTVTAHYTTSASEYKGKYYGSNNLWKFDEVSSGAKQKQAEPTPAPFPGETSGDSPF
jgi:hypothetical protein